MKSVVVSASRFADRVGRHELGHRVEPDEQVLLADLGVRPSSG